MPEEQNFYHTAPSEGRAAAQQQNPSYTPTTISPARIAENANLSDIFSFEFEANESPFLLSNAVANEQKAITAIYTEAEVEEKTICLILDTQTVIVTADGMKKTPVGEIDNFLFTLDGITIPVKVLLTISYQGQHIRIFVTCDTFNKHSEKAPVFEFELEEEKPLIETFMALGSTKQRPYILLKCKDCHKKLSSIRVCISPEEEYENHTYNTSCLTCGDMLLEECNWIDVAMRGGVCDQTCQYALSISEKVKRGTPFNTAYNSALNKLYYYPHNAKIIFDLAMALINRATKEDICQMKKAEYIEYTIELARFDYEDEVEVYHQIAKQMNIRLCEKCIMPYDEQWCSECYTLSIPIFDKVDRCCFNFFHCFRFSKFNFVLIIFTGQESALQLKYFNNNGQEIKPEKAHEINAEYDLRYPGEDTLVLKPKSLTKINLKIALKIPSGAMSSLASKGINVRGRIINAGYTGDITVMFQNETDKPFKIEHAEKIAQAIYLPLINISGLQLVNLREQLGKSDRRIQDFGSTGRFTVPVNIALNIQNKFYQILRLSQPITISFFGEHPEIYTCPKPTTTQQIFESNEQICLEHNISIPNIYISEGTKKVRVTFYNPNNYPIILLNNLEIGVIHNNIFQQELPQTVIDFSEIIGHSLPKINPNPSSKNYHVVIEKLSQINMGQLEPQQQTQLKELIVEFANIFAENNNDLGRTNLVQHQIYTGGVKPRRQQAY
ncbi:hypothetical protein G9A89_009812 [Geosiphon pyriformis]|nr:hypothetical protein G9A89_009812 [Geosiphon pyriformis]